MVTNCHVTVCHYTKSGKGSQEKKRFLNGMETKNFMMGAKRKSPVRNLVPGMKKSLFEGVLLLQFGVALGAVDGRENGAQGSQVDVVGQTNAPVVCRRACL